MIDFHTHPVMIQELTDRYPALWKAINEVYGFFFPPQPLSVFLLEMDEAGMESAVLLPVDCTTRYGCQIVTNVQVAEICAQTPRLIGFGSVDPCCADAPQQVERAVRALGLSGLHLDPALQGFFPDDHQHAYPVYQACAELGVPLMVACGMSLAPGGQARYAQPLLLEDAIQTFPNLTFILGRCAWPWVGEAVMLAVKYPNVYLDTAILYSGTPSDTYRRVFAGQVGLDVLERSLFNKLLFGSDYPRVDIRRSVRGVYNLGLSDRLTNRILSRNARQVLYKES